VTVGGARGQKTSLLPFLSAALLVPAVIMLLNSQRPGHGSSLTQTRATLASFAKIKAQANQPVLPDIKAAEAKGLVQAVRSQSQAAAKHNIATHAQAATSTSNAPGKAAAADKVAAGKSSEHIKAAAKRAVATHMMEEALSDKEEAAPLVVGSTDKNPEKILIKMYMESKCPACRKFSTTYVKQILQTPGLSDVVDFEYVAWGWGQIQEAPSEKQLELNPKADYTDNVLNHTSLLEPILKLMENPKKTVPSLMYQCQHGFEECEGNAWESCLQDVAPDHKDFFPVFDCVESRGCPEGTKPPDCVDTPANVMQGCLEEHGKHINSPELLACYHGDRMRELLVINDIATLEAKPQWVPWFTIDGADLVQDPDNENSTASFREQFLLGKRVCDAYVAKTGKEAPAGCANFPQNDEEVGVDPWAKFPKKNFTAFIDELNVQHLQLASAAEALREEQQSPWRFFKVKMLAVVVLVFAVGAASAYYCTSMNKKERDEGLLADQDNEDNA